MVRPNSSCSIKINYVQNVSFYANTPISEQWQIHRVSSHTTCTVTDVNTTSQNQFHQNVFGGLYLMLGAIVDVADMRTKVLYSYSSHIFEKYRLKVDSTLKDFWIASNQDQRFVGNLLFNFNFIGVPVKCVPTPSFPLPQNHLWCQKWLVLLRHVQVPSRAGAAEEFLIPVLPPSWPASQWIRKCCKADASEIFRSLGIYTWQGTARTLLLFIPRKTLSILKFQLSIWRAK